MIAHGVRRFSSWYSEVSLVLQTVVWKGVLRRRDIVGLLDTTHFTLLEIVGHTDRQLLRIGSHAYECDEDFDAALLALKRRGRRVTLRLSGELGLRKLLKLPFAAKDDLDQLLFFEMDRLSPFAASEVYFAHRILRKIENGSRILVEVHIVPRTIAHRAVATCKCLGLEPKRLELAGTEADVALDLLPRDAVSTRFSSRLDRALALLALMLVGLLLVAPLQNLRATVADLDSQIISERNEAEKSLALRQQLDALYSKMRLIDSHKKSTLAITRLIATLTRLIPDDAYLIELHIGGNEVRVRGFGRSATDVIRSLENSPAFLEGQFLAPIIRDPHNDLEQFHILIGLRRTVV